MKQGLFQYYEHELTFVRRLAQGFARQHPEVARRLILEEGQSRDPHVERLIEAFAFTAAGIHQRLDDGFPELTDALLDILYPGYLTPIPPLTIVQLTADPQKTQPEMGAWVPRGTQLFTRAVAEVPCRFKTTMDQTVWPLVVKGIDMPRLTTEEAERCPGVKSALRITLATEHGAPCASLRPDHLLFYLGHEPLSYKVYEALFRDGAGVLVKQRGKVVQVLPSQALEPVGFADNEHLLDPRGGVSSAHRLLQEYFAFPHKFLFARLAGLAPARWDPREPECEVWLLLGENWSELDGRLTTDHFRLGCVPAINQFSMTAAPIRLDHRRLEHLVLPEPRSALAYEVLSVESVTSTRPGSDEVTTFRPFYAIRHGDAPGAEPAFWHARRRESLREPVRGKGTEPLRDKGTDVSLALVNPDFKPADLSRFEVLHVATECSNRDLAGQIVFAGAHDFHAEKLPEITTIRSLLRQPTPPRRPNLASESRWRLVSSLCLNHLTLFDQGSPANKGAPALAALREVLTLYDFEQGAAGQQRIQGLVGVEARRSTRVLPDTGPVRGVSVDLWFDEDSYSGSGVFLFAAVLEQFLALQTTVNSYTATAARLRNRERLLKAWPPRTGKTTIL